MTMKPAVMFALAALAIGTLPVLAEGERRREQAEPRDCTPINGTHGYYGNLWCDGWDPDHAGHTLSFERERDGSIVTERSVRGVVIDRRTVRR